MNRAQYLRTHECLYKTLCQSFLYILYHGISLRNCEVWHVCDMGLKKSEDNRSQRDSSAHHKGCTFNERWSGVFFFFFLNQPSHTNIQNSTGLITLSVLNGHLSVKCGDTDIDHLCRELENDLIETETALLCYFPAATCPIN